MTKILSSIWRGIQKIFSKISCSYEKQIPVNMSDKDRRREKEIKNRIKHQWDYLFSCSDGSFIELLKSFEDNNHWIEFDDDSLLDTTDIRDLEINIGGCDYCLFQLKKRDGKCMVHITPKIYDVFQKQIKRAVKKGVIEQDNMTIKENDEQETSSITKEENAKYQEFSDKRSTRINSLMKNMGIGAMAAFVPLFTIPSIDEIKSIIVILSLACAYCITVLLDALRYCLDESDACVWWNSNNKKKLLLAEESYINTIKTARYNLVVNSILAVLFLVVDVIGMSFGFSIGPILTTTNCIIAATVLLTISNIIQFVNKRNVVISNIVSSLSITLLIAAIRFI